MYNELAIWLTLWKQAEEYAFWKECPSQVLQQKFWDSDRACRKAFDKRQLLKLIPVFKKKEKGDGIPIPQGFKILGRRTLLRKI